MNARSKAEEIAERLALLASRREQEGIYTDTLICSDAIAAIAAMQDALSSVINQIDAISGYLKGIQAREGSQYTPYEILEMGRKDALKALNHGWQCNERGEAE